jgi:uncharacterized protein YbaP (TraB family)
MFNSTLSKIMFPRFQAVKLCRGIAMACLSLVPSLSAIAASVPANSSGGGKHCLWRVTNVKAPFYLFGTMHSLQLHEWKFPPVIENAIRESHQFWFEIDPNRGDLFTKKLTTAAKYPKGTTIRDKVDPKTYATLVRISGSGFSSFWQNLRPWAIALIMFDPRYSRFAHKYGADNHVLEEAKWRGCPVGGIETMDEHIRVFSGMTDSEGEMCLLQTIVYSNEDAKNMPARLTAWQTGDCQWLYSDMSPRMKEAPSVWWRIIDHRNAMWIPRIETEIRTGIPTMIVAGALHFCGPHGVIALLEKRGYKIEQL